MDLARSARAAKCKVAAVFVCRAQHLHNIWPSLTFFCGGGWQRNPAVARCLVHIDTCTSAGCFGAKS